jgi:hypothetical protein
MTKPHKNTDLFDAARDVLGAPVFNAIEGAFRRMEHAEEEIAAAKRRFPEHAERIHRSFLLLCPSDVLMSAAETLYRLHCRELLERVAGGADTRAATKAELVALLADLSLDAPLDRSATLLYWQTFSALMPDDAAKLRCDIGAVAADSYDESCAQDLERKLRRKLRVSTRILESEPRSQVA